MTIDWESVARSTGAVEDTADGPRESGSTDLARAALAAILGDAELVAAVGHYVRGEVGAELVRSVLWLLRPRQAMVECYRIYREAEDLQLRRDAVELLRVVADRTALDWLDELLADDDDSIQAWAIGILDQLVMAELVEPDEAEPHLARAERHPNPAVRDKAAFIRTLRA